MGSTLCTGTDRPQQRNSGAPGRSLLARVATLVALIGVSVGVVELAQTGDAAAAAPNCSSTYQVQAGDGWTIIAARVGVKPRQLYAANGATHRTVIVPGQTLCLPASASAPSTTGAPSTTAGSGSGSGSASATCSKSYTVRAGDGWTVIARRVGVKVSALYQANNANASTPLYAGGSVCLPSSATPPAAAPTTTAAPAAPPTTAPRSYSQSEVESIIRTVWPDDQEDKALAVAWRESNHKPGVRNWCCFGLFQIHWNAHKSWLANLGITDPTQLYDPLVNTNAALQLYHRAGGWGPWGG